MSHITELSAGSPTFVLKLQPPPSPKSPRARTPAVKESATNRRRLPWPELRVSRLLNVWAKVDADRDLNVGDFCKLLPRVLDSSRNVETDRIARLLFGLCNRDRLEFVGAKELFLAMVMLCSESMQDRLRTVFAILDVEGMGKISRQQVRRFLVAVAPSTSTPFAKVEIMLATFMNKANGTKSGLVSYVEVCSCF